MTSRTFAEIVADLRACRPNCGDWMALDELSGELQEAGFYPDAVEDLLAVFEHFPEEDGAGVFWTILHRLESFGGYEQALICSVKRRPSQFGILMLGRLVNGGRDEVAGVSLLSMLESVAALRDVPASIRQLAQDFAEHHGSDADRS